MNRNRSLESIDLIEQRNQLKFKKRFILVVVGGVCVNRIAESIDRYRITKE